MKGRVLVVDDDLALAEMLGIVLRGEGIETEHVADGGAALEAFRRYRPDLVLLDVMLPDFDGFEVCRRLRAEDVWTPILMLTARDAVRDRVHGLDAGADDYLLKPFAVEELLARARAVARRGVAPRPTILEVGDLRLDPASAQAWRADTRLDLSAKELALLEAFMRRPGVALSRGDLLDLAWDHAYENRSNVVDVYVRYLREKVDRPFGRASLETVRGLGYRLVDDRAAGTTA